MPTVTLPELHDGQVELFNRSGRYTAVRCGRRWGKTMFAATLICDGVARGKNWGFFAPDYKIIAETYYEIHQILSPLIISASKIEGVIRCIGGGRVDFWTLNNKRAGRSRKYHGVVIDEAAFTDDDMFETWEKSIKPTLLDFRGVAWALSTPAGKDEDNWFYSICNDPESGFTEFHAPTAANPHLPEDEVAKLQTDNPPEVYRQEYLAEFVDWSGVAFFPVEKLLVNGKPVPMPDKCDVVGCLIDTAIKSGQEHNSTAVTYFSYNKYTDQPRTLILDWDIVQIEGADQADWLPSVFARCEELARICGARQGSTGAIIEDKATGTVLIQQSANLRAKGINSPAYPIDSKLTAMGKDERAIAASPYVYAGHVAMTEPAFNKTKVHKRISANHFLKQVTSFRIGSKDKDGKDLLDTFCYAVLITNGTASGIRKGI